MSTRVIIFDNDYRCYVDNHYIADKNGALIADLHFSLDDLSLNLNEMSDLQIWALCKPIIQAYEKGLEKIQNDIKIKILKILELKGE